MVIFTSKISILEAPLSQEQAYGIEDFPPCSLRWRMGKLWVSPLLPNQLFDVPALSSQEWVKQCLFHSPVTVVCLDPKIGEGGLQVWADACHQARKQAFLRLPAAPKLRQTQRAVSWRIKRLLDWLIAALLLLILSPILLGLALLVLGGAGQPVFTSQWRVGDRGKLFRILKFGTEEKYMKGWGLWLRQSRLDCLPQLLNVLRGEMSLIGLEARTLEQAEAMCFFPEQQQRLRALPGLVNAWHLSTGTTPLDQDRLHPLEINYLNNWSLWADMRMLLRSPSKTPSIKTPTNQSLEMAKGVWR
jgi:lipopolysaccharide/colanic/teichoic acid biosynthesis glycosyltransferase